MMIFLHFSFWQNWSSLGFLWGITSSFILEMSRLFSLYFFWKGTSQTPSSQRCSDPSSLSGIILTVINSLVDGLLMIAEIKYPLGIVGRFIAYAFISTMLWTFPGRIRHKLRHLGDDPNLLWPQGSTRLIRLHLDDSWEIPFADI